MKILEYKGMDFAIAIVIGIIIVMLIYGYKIHCNKRERFNVGGQWDTTTGPPPPLSKYCDSHTCRAAGIQKIANANMTPCDAQGCTDAKCCIPVCRESEAELEKINASYQNSNFYKKCAKYKVTPWADTGVYISKADINRFRTPSGSLTPEGYSGLASRDPSDNCDILSSKVVGEGLAQALACQGSPLMNDLGMSESPNICKSKIGDRKLLCSQYGRKTCNNVSDTNDSYLCYYNDSPNYNDISDAQDDDFNKMAEAATRLCKHTPNELDLDNADQYICRAAPGRSRRLLERKCNWPRTENTFQMFKNASYAEPNFACSTGLPNFTQDAKGNEQFNPKNARNNITRIYSGDFSCPNVCGSARSVRRKLVSNDLSGTGNRVITRNPVSRLNYLKKWMKIYITKKNIIFDKFLGAGKVELKGKFGIPSSGGSVLIPPLDGPISNRSSRPTIYVDYLSYDKISGQPLLNGNYYLKEMINRVATSENLPRPNDIKNTGFNNNGQQTIPTDPNSVEYQRAINFSHLAYSRGGSTDYYFIKKIQGIANTPIYDLNIMNNAPSSQTDFPNKKMPRFLFQTFLTHAHLYRMFSESGIPSKCYSDMNDIVKFKVTATVE